MQNDWKQTKNEQHLHNWQFQSPNFQSFTKLVPGQLFQRKVNQSLWKSKFIKKWSLGEKFQNFTIWSLNFQKLTPLVPENFKSGKLQSWSLDKWNLENFILWIFLKSGSCGPQVSVKFKNWFLCFLLLHIKRPLLSWSNQNLSQS